MPNSLMLNNMSKGRNVFLKNLNEWSLQNGYYFICILSSEKSFLETKM